MFQYGGTCINLVEKVQQRSSNESNFHFGVSTCWGLWLLLVNYVGSQLSGPHMNPAFSLVFYWVGQINFKRFLLYSAAQFLGFFCGSLTCFAVYYGELEDGKVQSVKKRRRHLEKMRWSL